MTKKRINEYIGVMVLPPDVTIINVSGNWISFRINHEDVSYEVSAKVFANASTYGIRNGRISKMSIIPGQRNPNADYLKQCIYNYSRGLDFKRTPKGLLPKILKCFPVNNND